MTSEALLDRLTDALGFPPVSVQRLAARPGRHGDWPAWADSEVVTAFEDSGIDTPWEHQVEAADLIHDGTHTAIATGTASGKSLAYLLPALTDVLGDQASVLYCAPTKALAQDQLQKLRSLELPGLVAATYDGDTPLESRPWIRGHANYVLTNPEMIHRGLLANHRSWRRFLRQLRYVVIDEAHQYRGVFGTHMSAILRRLRRIADHYESDPTFIAVSATMADPARSAGALFGLPVAPVTTDSSARGEVSLILADPAAVPADTTWQTGPTGELPVHADLADGPDSFSATADVLAELTRHGARSLGFIRARKGSEAMAAAVQDRVPEVMRTKVTAYRGGLLPEERREVEARLRRGDLSTVATTNALELGVDISGLDAVVICGWPGTRSSFLQQIGRAGRNGENAITALIASNDPLDRYLVNHPERILDEPLEAAVFDPANPHVLLPHLAAAVAELPFTDDPATWFGNTAPDLLSLLESRGWVRHRSTGWYWTARETPWATIDLRGAGRGPVTIAEAGTGRLLGTVDESSAPAQVHPGAVYRHLGRTFVIESLDLGQLVAVARPDRPGYTTSARSTSDLRIVSCDETRPLGRGTVGVGNVRVTSQVMGFVRRSSTGRFLGMTPLDLPETVLSTRAVWWHLPDQVITAAGLTPAQVPGGVHAAEHAAIGLLPGLATCDRWDIGGLSSALHPDTGAATVFVHDGHPGGAGIAQYGYDRITDWLALTREVIARCRCATGCPGCVQSPKCGNGNDPLDKHAAVVLLDLLLAEQPDS